MGNISIAFMKMKIYILVFLFYLTVTAVHSASPNFRFSDAPREFTDQAILRCDTDSVGRFKPDIVYDWYKNGTHVSRAPELYGKVKMTKNGALVINRVNHFMHGEYICNINSNNHTIGLSRIIFDRLQHVEAGRRCDPEYCVNVEDCYAPFPPKKMALCSTINEVCCDLEKTAPIGIPAKGKTGLLRCANQTKPDLHYQWMRSGFKLSDHPAFKDKFTVTKSGHLLLNSVTDSDYGEFTCIVNGQVQGIAVLDDSKILDPNAANPAKCVLAKECSEPVAGGACPEEGEVECDDLSNVVLQHCENYNGSCKKSCEPAYARKALNCPSGFTCCATSTLLDPLLYVSTASSTD